MKFDLISDTHWDFYFNASSSISERKLNMYIDKHFSEQGSSILIHAGDSGHYTSQDNLILEKLAERYEHILIVGGNHNLYNISSKQKNKFKTWQYKFQNWKDKTNEVKNVTVLDGNIIEIDGVTFGGAMGWYDGSYFYENFLSPYQENLISKWKSFSNDSNKIPGLYDFLDIFEKEKPKIDSVYDKCDVMITHFQPTIYEDFFPYKYRMNSANAFYSFNYNDKIKEAKKTKVWCYGHTHDASDKMLGDVRLVVNPIGYPGENPLAKVRTIEIN